MSKRTIGATLRRLREESSLSVKQVIRLLKDSNFNISDKTLYSYENDTRAMSADMLLELCKIYKCPHVLETFSDIEIDYSIPSDTEWRLIEKYRTLDTHGTEMVDYVLEKEYDRCQLKEDQLTYVDPESQSNLRTMQYYPRLASAGSGEYLFDDIPTDTITVENTPLSGEADFIVGVNGKSMEPTYSDGELVFVKKASKIPIGEIGIFTKGSECFIKELGSDRLISHNADKARYPDIFPDEEIRLVGAVLGKAEKL